MKEYITANIPKDIEEKYNYALKQLAPGKGTLVGNEEELNSILDSFNNPYLSGVMILGEQGIGKTALLEQLLFLYPNIVAISLSIELLGALGDDLMISRMRTLLGDMKRIRDQIQSDNEGLDLKVILFIDEIHKLNGYGQSNGSSAALNALKEGLARSEFNVVAATTDYEYRKDIAPDYAFDRRFSKIMLKEPNLSTVRTILTKLYYKTMKEYKERGAYFPRISEGVFNEIINYSDAFIRNQVNPAKSIAILGKTIGREITEHNLTGKETVIDHNTVVQAFNSEGYNIDSLVTADEAKNIISSQIKGQPLAIQAITDTINSSFYTKRDLKKPFMTIFAVGTTGTGKSATAKALAEAFFHSRNAMIVLNGGDYVTPQDAIKAQHYIGDRMQTNKQKVILLDEIEKSHTDVLFAYMRMIDEGIVLDSRSQTWSLNNTIIMATSNLGATIFKELEGVMNREDEENPNKWTQELSDKWFEKKNDVREALIVGDYGKDNGIKPEFLERFQNFIPYFSLPRKTKAELMHKELVKFQREEKSMGYNVQLPAVKSNKEWAERISGATYDDVDPISVMFAEDIMSKNSEQTGARAIFRYINESVKPKFAAIIADREGKGLPVDGAVILKTNGKASFESAERGASDIVAEYVTKERLEMKY